MSMGFQATLSYLRQANESIQENWKTVAAKLRALRPEDLSAQIEALFRLNQDQEVAKSGKTPVTERVNTLLDEASAQAIGAVQMAKGYFTSTGRTNLLRTIPARAARKSFEAAMAFLESVNAFLKKNTDIPGVDRKALDGKIRAVASAKAEQQRAHSQSKPLTTELVEKSRDLVSRAAQWIDLQRAVARIAGLSGVEAKVPVQPRRRGGRKSKAPAVAPKS